MEQACQRCGSTIESPAPFCPTCEAPQIRFSGRQAASGPVAVLAAPPPVVAESTYDVPAPASKPNQHAALRSALHAGVIAAVLSLIPLRPAFVFALPLAGFLCILLYRRRVSGEISPAAGFRMGALAGLFGFAVFVVLTAVTTLVSHAENELREAMLQAIQQAQTRSPDPQARQMLEYFTTPHGLIVMMILGFAFTGVMFMLLSGVGGSISAALLRRKGPPA